MEKVLRDYLKFGNGAVQFVPSAAGNSFAGVNPVNALYRRYSEVDEYGACKCIIPDIGRNVRTRANTPGWMCSPNTTRRCMLRC